MGNRDAQMRATTASGVGERSTQKFVKRVLKAILSLHDNFIHWPNREEKAAMKQRISAASRGVFSNAVGFIEGTFISLQDTPLENRWHYFNRRSSEPYALHTMVVCSDQRKILYVRAGDTSASHDTQVFDSSLLNLEPQQFFDDGEYLIGDSAYTISNRMIAPYNTPCHSAAHAVFNAMLSTQRVAVEHTIEILKARFPSIMNVSIRIEDLKSHKTVVDWFLAACILHNFLIDVNDRDWEDTDDRLLAKRHQALVEQAQEAQACRLAAAEQEGEDDVRLLVKLRPYDTLLWVCWQKGMISFREGNFIERVFIIAIKESCFGIQKTESKERLPSPKHLAILSTAPQTPACEASFLAFFICI
jgi:hypothetical protein